jgi:hypothetical protein
MPFVIKLQSDADKKEIITRTIHILITILNGGTRGDTQPYVALGVAPKKAGYRVRLAAFAPTIL